MEVKKTPDLWKTKCIYFEQQDFDSFALMLMIILTASPLVCLVGNIVEPSVSMIHNFLEDLFSHTPPVLVIYFLHSETFDRAQCSIPIILFAFISPISPYSS